MSLHQYENHTVSCIRQISFQATRNAFHPSLTPSLSSSSLPVNHHANRLVVPTRITGRRRARLSYRNSDAISGVSHRDLSFLSHHFSTSEYYAVLHNSQSHTVREGGRSSVSGACYAREGQRRGKEYTCHASLDYLFCFLYMQDYADIWILSSF